MGVFSPSFSAFTEPYKFFAYRNAAWTPSAGSFAKVQFDTVVFDTGSNYDSVTNFQFVAPIAGFYWFSAAASVTAGASNSTISLFHQGTEYIRGTETPNNTGTTGYAVSGMVQCASGDAVSAQFFGASGQSGTTGQAVTYFQGFLLSPT